MTLLRKKESKFGAPSGIYVGKFLGLSPMKDNGTPRLGRDGKPMEPGVEWQFEVTEGDYAGQIVGRITSAVPTTKNACGTLLDGLVGRTVAADEDVDVDQYKGHAYQIVIGPSKENPERTQVVQIVRQRAGGQAAAPPRPAAPKPPAPAAANGTAAADVRMSARYWVQKPDWPEPHELTGQQVALHVNGCKSPAEVDTIMVMDAAQTSGWQKPSHFGFKPDIPF